MSKTQETALLSHGYEGLLKSLKERIHSARLKAALSVNEELIFLYWQIGADILSRQRAEGWGAKIIDRLSKDLHRTFPEMQGLSPRNLKYMRAFAEIWPDISIVQATLAQLPWYHNIALLEKLKNQEERFWYARQAIEHGWSRNVLVHQIETGLYARQGKALTNFSRTLPPLQSDLAQQIIKNPYNFDFLALGPEMLERDLERGLTEHLRDLILELGKGFAFIGNQYPLEIAGQDYHLDLLFYHLRLRCFVVMELKIEDFKPEFAGKMNFYLSAVDDLLRHPDDQASIGIILCKGHNEMVVEYALRDTSKPMGVAQYRLTAALPEVLQQELPTADELAREFPLFSLVRLRIEIEQALYKKAERLGLIVDSRLGIRQLIQQIQNKDARLEADNFLRLLNTINFAAHGRDAEPSAAREALRVAKEFLARIRSEE